MEAYYSQRHCRFSTGLFWLMLAAWLTAVGPLAQTNPPVQLPRDVTRVGTLEHYALLESSGLVESPRHPGVFWTHNDTENPAFLFAITREGAHVGAYEVQGANLIDWEAVAADDAGYLYFADTGTNGMIRSHSTIHRVIEPDIDERWGPARVVQTWYIRFPGEREDCESLFILNGYAYLISKYPVNGRVTMYRFSLADRSESVPLELVTGLAVESPVADASLSDDGAWLALATEDGVQTLFINGNPASAFRAPSRFSEFDGESMEGIEFVPEGLLATSETFREILLFTSPLLSGAPSILAPLEDQFAFVGRGARFTVQATGVPAPAFEWRFNGEIIPGATTATLVLTNLALTNAGIYEVTVRNAAGAARASASLTVTERVVDLRVTEVMSDEASNVMDTSDWWELTSFDSETNDLSGWRFNDSLGGLDDAFTLPAGIFIRPGETIVFVEEMTGEEFRTWWGEENVPAEVQIVTYAGSALSFRAAGDSLRLWNAATTDTNEIVARVDFGQAEDGVSFSYDPESEELLPSRVGVNGAFRAATSADIGSPGFAAGVTNSLSVQGQLRAGGFEIQFQPQPGHSYGLEWTEDLASGIWFPADEEISPGSSPAIVLELPSGPRRFYRVRRQ